MIYWALLVHFYQPPTQIHSVLDKVTDESYRPLLNMLRENSNARVTVNICGVLTEMLAEHGKFDVIEGLAELAAKGQIEFTGTSKYHAILPLIPKDEIKRQINENSKINRTLIGKYFQPRGFFPPEMCFSRDIVDPILNAGHEWILISGVACPVDWPLDVVHYIKSPIGKLSVFFRDDVLSNRISFKELDVPGFLKHLIIFGDGKDDIYVITAMDAETFGHHIKNWEQDFLGSLYLQLRMQKTLPRVSKQSVRSQPPVPPDQASAIIKSVTISELLDNFQAGKAILPKSSSWSTTSEDLKDNNPYPLWDSPGNQVHKLLWEHMNLTIEMVENAINYGDTEAAGQFAGIARELLDPALHSDQFWWASRRPHWDVNMINRGFMLQQECFLNAYMAIRNSSKISESEKRQYYYRRLASSDITGRLYQILFDT